MPPKTTTHSLPWSKRIALTRRLSRRWLGAVGRGRQKQVPHPDDLQNLRSLWWSSDDEKAECPLCGYFGGFLHHFTRPRQICPDCGSRSRHRVLYLALNQWREDQSVERFHHVLHLAPEPCLEPLFRGFSKRRVRADLDPRGVDLSLDLCRLPFADQRFDFIFASHVLEHIVDDRRAISECFRALRPGGLAILIVPITELRTVDYGFADGALNNHARKCGPDYFDRYREAGFQVETVTGRQVGNVERGALETWQDGERVEHHIPFCLKPVG